MTPWQIVLTAAPILIGVTLVGAWLQPRLASSHVSAQSLLSFVGGLMIGMALLHLLPHAAVELGSLDSAVVSMLIGVLVVYLLMRFFHVHGHSPGVAGLDTGTDDGHAHATHVSGPPVRATTLFLGLSLHAIMDGLAIAAAVKLEALHGARVPGLGVLIVVLLHKPIDAVALAATMRPASTRRATLAWPYIAYALITPAAAIAALAGFSGSSLVAGHVMAIAAGAFLCIALADLMPEVQFHSHHRLRLAAALFAGVGVAIVLGFFEGEHAHDVNLAGHAHQDHATDHNHQDHDHGHPSDDHIGHDH
ncbi:MAG: ZIP family metal transporter [Planctomycetota bacterium]